MALTKGEKFVPMDRMTAGFSYASFPLSHLSSSGGQDLLTWCHVLAGQLGNLLMKYTFFPKKLKQVIIYSSERL